MVYLYFNCRFPQHASLSLQSTWAGSGTCIALSWPCKTWWLLLLSRSLNTSASRQSTLSCTFQDTQRPVKQNHSHHSIVIGHSLQCKFMTSPRTSILEVCTAWHATRAVSHVCEETCIRADQLDLKGRNYVHAIGMMQVKGPNSI